MEYANVSSSNVSAVGFDDESSTLGVRFTNGAEYNYFGVPRNVFDSLLSAPSVGRFLNQYVKSVYPYQRVG